MRCTFRCDCGRRLSFAPAIDCPGVKNEKALWLVFAPTALSMVAEIFGSLLTGSLAPISDASHMATDVFGWRLP
jgi:Co/Zn/Cd efflux system component